MGRLLGPLLKTELSLIGFILKPLSKGVLIPLGLTVAVSATDEAIHRKIFGSGNTTLVIFNDEMNDIMKIVKSLEESGLLIKGVRETIQKEAKKQKRGFLSMLLGALDASLLGNLLTAKSTEGLVKARLEQATIFNATASFNKFSNTKVLSK